ncbi:MAG TPA: cbb3-type cytochrome c oxidase subunit 3 [Burkholderiaceae bacterium]|nr:cbb3-type cytochrome c oxidase subunit 3 [Burkholderiaceae bacterium]HMX12266.1 cbb3-type cytochrome c oxidase subunit 3 [Burkholderiaceae bacterium]HMZ01722.1 cbb3-type cytochrome c oxidase subunit 3 [Burkholderiaceae bacterium]HNB43019.1 cbb3-type cytochrome c oxidase subunit 3 [Burkholderiaceae bacterium]HNG80276.1 cbb3-type cytochrome c oxidase subunit 3 [Burkholderiaceae bacterium]
MDLNDLRSLFTVASFAIFLGILAWAFARKNLKNFNDAAQLPFEGEGASSTHSGGTHE